MTTPFCALVSSNCHTYFKIYQLLMRAKRSPWALKLSESSHGVEHGHGFKSLESWDIRPHLYFTLLRVAIYVLITRYLGFWLKLVALLEH